MWPTLSSEKLGFRRAKKPEENHMKKSKFSTSLKIQELGYWRLEQVLEIIPVSKTTWYEGVRLANFPAPKKIGRSSFWRKKDILDLLLQIEEEGLENQT